MISKHRKPQPGEGKNKRTRGYYQRPEVGRLNPCHRGQIWAGPWRRDKQIRDAAYVRVACTGFSFLSPYHVMWLLLLAEDNRKSNGKEIWWVQRQNIDIRWEKHMTSHFSCLLFCFVFTCSGTWYRVHVSDQMCWNSFSATY